MLEGEENFDAFHAIHTVLCPITGGTPGKGVILHEKISEMCKTKFFHTRPCYRENWLQIFSR